MQIGIINGMYVKTKILEIIGASVLAHHVMLLLAKPASYISTGLSPGYSASNSALC